MCLKSEAPEDLHFTGLNLALRAEVCVSVSPQIELQSTQWLAGSW